MIGAGRRLTRRRSAGGDCGACFHGRGRLCHRRRGYVLVFVLAFAAIVAAAGTGYLAAYANAAPQAYNQLAASRAAYLAASGVSMGCHYLAMPPTTVAAGQYWSGVNGLSIDGTADTITVGVSRNASRPTEYSITSSATVRAPDSSIKAVKTVTAAVATPPPAKFTFSRVWIGAGNLNLGSYLELTGAVHANGDIVSTATKTTAVTATGAINWVSSPMPSSITTNTTPVAIPSATPEKWNRYAVHGIAFEAAPLALSSLADAVVPLAGGSVATSFYVGTGANHDTTVIDPSGTLTGGAGGLGAGVNVQPSATGAIGALFVSSHFITPTNPGGVLVRNGDLDLTGLNFMGTLVVTGRVRSRSGTTNTITAMPNYPGLVVLGDVEVESASTLTINGAVVSQGRIRGQQGTLIQKGTWIVAGEGPDSDLGQTIATKCNYVARFARTYDFSPGSSQPMTLLSWSE